MYKLLVVDDEKTVVENRNGLLFVNSVNTNLPFEKAPDFVRNTAEKPVKNEHKEEIGVEIKIVNDLRKAYPTLVDEMERQVRDEERQRIQDIEEMALPGSEEMTNEAKFVNPISASEYAKAAMKRAKEQGDAYLNDMTNDASNSGMGSVKNIATGGQKPDEFLAAIQVMGKKQ